MTATNVTNAGGFGWGTGGSGGEGAGTVPVRSNGATVDAAPTALDFRGGGKTVQDFSGITAIFLPTNLDIRAYGAVPYTEAQWSGMDSTTRAANRALNATALQNATNDSQTSTAGSRRVYLPGDYNDVYEFDTPITYESGAMYTTEHGAPHGSRLMYYGAVDTHAFQTNRPNPADSVSVVVFSGIRLFDMRGSGAATGTGCGIDARSVRNGTIVENCHIRGFYRNIWLSINDMVRVNGGWIGQAHNYGIYADQLSNHNSFYDLAIDVDAAGLGYTAAPNQLGIMYVTGGGTDAEISIRDIKIEGTNATAHGFILNGPPTTGIEGVVIRSSVNSLADLVRIQGTAADGIGENVVLERIVVESNSAQGGGAATNLLHVVPSDGGDYTIPVHPTQNTGLIHWTAQHRELMRYARPGSPGGYAWTQGASGTSAAGTVVPSTGAGQSGTPTITVNGDDERGEITLLTSSSPATGAAQVLSMFFRVPWPRTPRGISLTPANAQAAADIAKVFVGSPTGSQADRTYWRLYAATGVALAATTTYKWHYQVLP